MRIIDGGRLLVDYCKANCGKIPDNEEVCPNCHAAQMIASAPTIDPSSLRPKGDWVSVEDRLPERGQHVIVSEPDYDIGEAVWVGDIFEWVSDENIAFASHWMPLPEPPAKEAT